MPRNQVKTKIDRPQLREAFCQHLVWSLAVLTQVPYPLVLHPDVHTFIEARVSWNYTAARLIALIKFATKRIARRLQVDPDLQNWPGGEPLIVQVKHVAAPLAAADLAVDWEPEHSIPVTSGWYSSHI